MKLLVISDTHLTDRFNEKKYQVLHSLISDADQVLLNGDFWEGFETTFDQFIASPWNTLFPLLKQKKTIYLYGNHDKQSFSDERSNLFSVQTAETMTIESGDKRFIFEHGHSYCKMIDEQLGIVRTPKWASVLATYIQDKMIRNYGPDLMHKLFHKLNKDIHSNVKGTLKHNEIFVCGHTHVSENSPHLQFLNTGFINYGLAQYATIQNGVVRFEQLKYD
jgi:predicted phosphodiesterase